MLNLNIPKKIKSRGGDELYNHQVRLNADKTIKFTRVRESLGGYSSAELLEILVDKVIESYYDGEDVKDLSMLPKQLEEDAKEELARKKKEEEEGEVNA